MNILKTALEAIELLTTDNTSEQAQAAAADARIKLANALAQEDEQAVEPVAWVKEDELTDLRSCNGRSIWAESPSIWFDEVPAHLVPVYKHPYPPLASEQAMAVEPFAYINKNGIVLTPCDTGPDDVPLYLHPAPQQVSVPQGYVLVPIEPTEEMIAAAEDIEDLHRRGTPETWGKVYKAMLAAAQGEKP